MRAAIRSKRKTILSETLLLPSFKNRDAIHLVCHVSDLSKDVMWALQCHCRSWPLPSGRRPSRLHLSRALRSLLARLLRTSGAQEPTELSHAFSEENTQLCGTCSAIAAKAFKLKLLGRHGSQQLQPLCGTCTLHYSPQLASAGRVAGAADVTSSTPQPLKISAPPTC